MSLCRGPWFCIIVFIVLIVSSSFSFVQCAADETPPFSVPDGFSVQKVADDKLVHDCFCMTMDSLGRPVVSGPGYITTLIDDDGDGGYDRGIAWSSPTQGAQGLWSEGRKLYYVSDGGLWVSEDKDGNLQADPGSKKILEIPTGGEHDVHAIRKGPDGHWYFIAGNFARDISKLQNDSNSIVPRGRSGTIWRMSPDFSSRSVWAHGMRNCYDFDFLPDGQIVTFDSDCEREASLPWYRPTRIMVLGPASDAGWCGSSWKDEDHRITMPLTLAQLGRGSPTGIAVYQHRAFPKKYHDAIFALDWTFGRVIAVFPSRNLDESKRIPNKVPAEIFMQPSGNAGFAPTDICVAKDGSLLICVGGRGTSGSIYRVMASVPETTTNALSLDESSLPNKLNRKQKDTLLNIMTSPMPQESWSEARWVNEFDATTPELLLGVIGGSIAIHADPDQIAAAKMRCALALTRTNTLINIANIQNLLTSPSGSTRAAAWWIAGRGKINLRPQDMRWLTALANINFGAAEFNANVDDVSPWEEHLGRADARLRWEAFGLRKWSLSAANSQKVEGTDAGNTLRRTWLWALARSGAQLPKKSEQNTLDMLIAKQLYGAYSTSLDTMLLDVLASWVPDHHASWNMRDQLEFLTLLQAALGDRRYSLPLHQDSPSPNALDGYRAISSNKLPENVRKAWIGWALYFAKHAASTERPLVHLEATRALAMLEPKDSESLSYLLQLISETTHPTSDIHWLCCIANCSGTRTNEQTRKTANALSGVVRKVKARGLYTDNQWPIRLQQLVTALVSRDAKLGEAFVELPVPCCPEDIVLLSAFPVDVQSNARKKMRQYLIDTPPSDWPPAILRYASQLGIDDTFAAAIRAATKTANLRSTAIELLSTLGKEADYELFLESLESDDRNLWGFGWKGINGLAITDAQREWKAITPVVSSVLNTASSLPRAGVLNRARSIATKLSFGPLPNNELWTEWESALRNHLDEVTLQKLYRPGSKQDWRSLVQQSGSMAGDVQRGKVIYQEKCALCHGGQSSLGPSLAGVSKRFSREDLARAIFEPSRDIPDRYRAIRVLTMDGEIYTGMNIYSSADGITLQTANGNIVRINQDNIDEKAYSTESIMPVGLLDEKSPADVANLFAYLNTQ